MLTGSETLLTCDMVRVGLTCQSKNDKMKNKIKISCKSSRKEDVPNLSQELLKVNYPNVDLNFREVTSWKYQLGTGSLVIEVLHVFLSESTHSKGPFFALHLSYFRNLDPCEQLLFT